MTRLVYTWPLSRFMLTPEKGADTLVWLATAEPGTDWTPGEFYVKRKPAPKSAQAADAALAVRLWDWSESVTWVTL